MSDPWADPEAKAWRHRVEAKVAPMIDRSSVVVSIAPRKGQVDAKFAVELGMSIMLDKPILIVAETNDDVPPKLRAVADRIFIGSITDPDFQELLAAAMKEMMGDAP